MCAGSQFRKRKGQLYTNVIDPILMQPGIAEARPGVRRWLSAPTPLAGSRPRHPQTSAATGSAGAGPGWQEAPRIYLFIFPDKLKTQGALKIN